MNSFTNVPVFITGDTPFVLMVQLSYEDADLYLADRAKRGFNALWVGAVDAADQANAPKNFYGEVPFNGPDFTNENPEYWAYVDKVVRRAHDYGIVLILDPAFVGSTNDGGYLKSYLDSSDAVMTAYGSWLGSRYKIYDNIIWSLGGDANPSLRGLYRKIEDLAEGLAETDPNHLITLEALNQSTLDAYDGIPPLWLGLNRVYNTEATVISGCQRAFKSFPNSLPPLMGEDWYELEHSVTGDKSRVEGYFAVLSGCYLGRVFGNGAIWTFNSPKYPGLPDWKLQLTSVGSVSQALLGKLFSSREHWKLVPDIDHTVVTSGFGSGFTTTTAARTNDGQTIIAYIPNGKQTTFTVDMTKISSKSHRANGWWFNPRDGATSRIGTFATEGSQSFTAPDSNDWVLLIDDADANLSAPGITQPANAIPPK